LTRQSSKGPLDHILGVFTSVPAGLQALWFGSRQFAYVNVVLIVIWLVLAVAIGRRFEPLPKTAVPT
jgi:hypothetical protein